MPDNSNNHESDNWTTILKALADESRLQIIHALLNNEASVQDLSDSLEMKIYNISKHLKILETSGLVQKRKNWCAQDIPYYRQLKVTSHRGQQGA
ncbi:MAG: winged helix-turn-helix transcriptional regulator [Nitrospira sp.]|nr:winged helix-turn-helix transcriptional regulator [bacterium]MBL7049564.1 winged helix-turn-helix transcriptional regulator [Nitrospira sp.]